MATTTTSTRSDGGNTKENKRNDTDRMMQRMLWISRSGFLVTLSCVVISLCILYSQLLKRSELALGEQQFYSIASRATTEASRIVRRKMHAASVLSRLIAHAHPETEPWPFVTVDGFEDISQQLIVATDGTGMAFAPFVEHASLDDFEDFAYTFYNSTRKPPFVKGTAVSSFGTGVWGLDETLPSPDMRYHDNQIQRNYVTPNEMVVPILQHSDGPSSVLMLNLRFEESRGKAIDSLVACVTESTRPSCAEITSVIELASSEHPSPGALLLDPIQPVNGESNTSSGVVLSTLVWEELFENVFSDEVSGIYCVLEQAGTSLTYVIEDGVASLRDSLPADILKFEDFKTSVHLTPEDLFDSSSPQCILSLYPSQRFFAVYSTKNPRVAAWGTFVAIALTSLVFVLYDYFVRKEFTNKRELLEAKRKFMRWVCHEVRTPLNSLCLGLNIVRSELKNKLHELQDDGSSDQTDDSGGRDNGGNGQNRSRSPPTLVQIEEWLGLTTELQANANLAVDVLSDLLNYDRIERNNLALEMSVFQLVSLVEKTAAEFRLTAMGKHVNLVTELNCTETTLTCGDKMRLGHVLRNIIANRLKSTPAEGTVTISIKTDLFPQPRARRTFDLRNGRKTTMEPVGNATVSVVNTGEGMSADEINTLFQDGLQFDVNNLQNGNGSGLGLYISKGVVDKHGGSMSVQSTGLETTMSFQLLVYGCDDSSVESPPRCGSDTATESLSAPRTSEEGFGSRSGSGSGSNSGSGSGGQRGGGSGSGSGSGSRSNSDSGSGSNSINGSGHDPNFPPSSLRLLVVDDSVSNRKLLMRTLAKLGHRCVGAEDGAAAVRLLGESMTNGEPFDSVLLDFEMPIQNGPSAAAEMRSMGYKSCIVGVTGNVMSEDVRHFQCMGADDVLAKPLNVPDLEALWVDYGLVGGTGRLSDRKETGSPKNACVVENML